jgi:hypothetical protein
MFFNPCTHDLVVLEPLLEYGEACEEAGLDCPRNSFIIVDRKLAVAWFEEALAAYDEAHPDQAPEPPAGALS